METIVGKWTINFRERNLDDKHHDFQSTKRRGIILCARFSTEDDEITFFGYHFLQDARGGTFSRIFIDSRRRNIQQDDISSCAPFFGFFSQRTLDNGH